MKIDWDYIKEKMKAGKLDKKSVTKIVNLIIRRKLFNLGSQYVFFEFKRLFSFCWRRK